ncbi:MAG: hypothetical protein U0Q16_34505 [Bryobacteraceae bacterium]
MQRSSQAQSLPSVLERLRSGEDVLWTQPGVDLPELARERLAWSAARMPGIASVSPLVCTVNGDLGLADRAAAAASDFDLLETESPSRECVYLRAEAVQAALAAEPSAAKSLDALFAACRRARFSHRLAADIVVRSERGTDLPPPVLEMRLAGAVLPTIGARTRPRLLHILHGWGGGAEQWVRQFVAADTFHENFVLRAESQVAGFAARQLTLLQGARDEPLEIVSLSPGVTACDLWHSGYAASLDSICDRYGTDGIIVSSLVGHSLDALRTGIPTAIVCHDYFPFCPAFNITFSSPCSHCDEAELRRCARENPLNQAFPHLPSTHWSAIRREFVRTVQTNRVKLIAPTASVQRNWAKLLPQVAAAVQVIPHGLPHLASEPVATSEDDTILRVVVLGRVSAAKGQTILERVLAAKLPAEFLLAGCGSFASEARRYAHVKAVPEYRREDLPQLLDDFRPDLGLLLSTVPETFSYTLDELRSCGIPPVATRLGAFEDRIRHGIDGLLVEPHFDEVSRLLADLHADRSRLHAVRANLEDWPPRTVEEMIGDYRSLGLTPEHSSRAYFCTAARESRQRLPLAVMQLHWAPQFGEFSPAWRSSITIPMKAERQSVRLEFPALDPGLGALRLDFGSKTGFLALAEITARDGAGTVIWRWRNDAAALAKMQSNQLALLGPSKEGDVRLYMSGDDPNLTLPLSATERVSLRGGGSVEAAISFPPGADLSWWTKLWPQYEGKAADAVARAIELEAELANMRESRTWRMTAPFRRILE